MRRRIADDRAAPPARPAGAAPARFARLAALLALGLAGCGAGSDLPLAPVSGKVTYKGNPLESGTVVFFPQAGTPGPQAVGEIGAGGAYRIVTNGQDGAAVGAHKVTVESRAEQSEEAYKKLEIPRLVTPVRYANEAETPLTIAVKEGANEFNIELDD